MQVTSDFDVVKIDDERRQVFGWAYIAQNADGETVIDKQGDWIEPDDLETAAIDHVLHSRRSDSLHDEVTKGTLIESIVFTPAKVAKMGLPPGSVPAGWWVGYQIDDADEWASVKTGEHLAFSIGGSGVRHKMAPASQ